MGNENTGIKPLPELNDEFLSQFKTEDDTTDWEAVAKAVHQEGKSWEGTAKRNYSDLEKLKNQPPKKEEEPKKEGIKNEGLDYGQKAYLVARGVENKYFDLVLETMKDTGKDLDSLLDSKWFQAELKERRESDTTASAMETARGGSKRTSNSLKNTAEYYADISKGLPEDPKLRKEVLELRKRNSGRPTRFSDNPIA